MKQIFKTALLMMTASALAVGSTACQKKEPEPEATAVPVELYQLAPENLSLMQCFVIKTRSGKLIVVDGGIDGEGRDREPYLPAALRAIAGVGEGEYFEVEAWFLSHAHKDHFYELAKMLNRYSKDSNYKINNFYFDFPDYGTEAFPHKNEDSTYLKKLKKGLNIYADVNQIAYSEGSSYYEELNGAFINADTVEKGLELEIDGVRIEVLQTWALSDGSDVNSSSIVLRMWVDGQSVLFLNDLGAHGGERLLAKGIDIKSDIVQMAHHGQAGVKEEVYKAIQSKVHLWVPPIWVWTNTTTFRIGETRKWLYGEDFTEADQYNIVACLYKEYPKDPTSVSDWVKVKDYMKITLPYEPAM